MAGSMQLCIEKLCLPSSLAISWSQMLIKRSIWSVMHASIDLLRSVLKLQIILLFRNLHLFKANNNIRRQPEQSNQHLEYPVLELPHQYRAKFQIQHCRIGRKLLFSWSASACPVEFWKSIIFMQIHLRKKLFILIAGHIFIDGIKCKVIWNYKNYDSLVHFVYFNCCCLKRKKLNLTWMQWTGKSM